MGDQISRSAHGRSIPGVVLCLMAVGFVLGGASQAMASYEYWVSYREAHTGPSGTHNGLYATAPGSTQIVMDGETLEVPAAGLLSISDFSEGTQIVSPIRLEIVYRYYMGDHGAYEDGGLSYSLLSTEQLGTRYWVPADASLVAVLSVEDGTRLEAAGVDTVLQRGESIRFYGLAGGSLLQASQPFYATYVHYGASFYDQTYAAPLLPESLLGREYVCGDLRPHAYRSPTSYARVELVATADETSIQMGDSLVVLEAGETTTFRSDTAAVFVATQPVGAQYVFDVYARDPLDGNRHYCYAYPLVAREHAPTFVGTRPGSYTQVAAFEDSTFVEVNAGGDADIDWQGYVHRGKAVRLNASVVSDYAGGTLKLFATGPVQVETSASGSWQGVTETILGWGGLAHMSAPAAVPSFGCEGLRYQLVSFPYACPEGASLADLMPAMGSPGPHSWRAFAYQGGTYVENPSLSSGQGFWLGTLEDQIVALPGCSADPRLDCELTPGWNIVGAPLAPFAWSDCSIQKDGQSWSYADSSAASLVSRRIYWYEDLSANNQNDGQWRSALLEECSWDANPAGGYLLLADSACTFSFPEAWSKREPVGGADTGRAGAVWSVRLEATSREDAPSVVEVGAHPAAARGFDREDVARPPAPFGGRSLWIEKPGGRWNRYARDYQTPDQTFWAWDLRWGGEPEGAAGVARLDWKVRGDLPKGVHAYLVDERRDVAIDMQVWESYEFLADRARDFRIELTKEPWRGHLLDGTKGRIDRLHPRLARNHVEIRYHVGVAGPVLLTMHDVTGRLVHTLCQDLREPGTYQAVWSAAQHPLPAGVYFVRLVTPAAEDSQRLMLLP